MERLMQVTVTEKQEIHKLLPGEMTLYALNQCWYIGCPSENCGVGNLGGHMVTQDEQGITVTPSILCGCGAHYFVERNQIRWVL
jgi:Family of unknown function (DUF6527)